MIKRLKNNIFFKSTMILLLGGTLTKIVGLFLKIIITRNIGTEGMGLYSLLGGTTSLLCVCAVFTYPTAISTLISRNKYNSKDLIFSSLIISVLINIFLVLIVFLFAPYLSNNLLKEPKLYFPIICIGLTLPFISISSIIKGYFWGKQNMFPYMLSNLIEQITRIILISIFITKIVKISIILAISFIILVNIIGEIVSVIVMIYYFPRIKIKVKDLKFNVSYIKDLLKITVPATISKIIGSISYFLEPIILTNILLHLNYSKEYIVYEYGIINAYALSLLLMPQFFTQNMSYSLVPELSKYYSIHDYKMRIKRIKQIILISVLIGTISTLIILSFPKFFLNLLWNTSEGIDYIKLLAPFTILFYIEYPLINALQALNKAKTAMNVTFILSIVKLSTIVLFSLLGFGMYSLVISIIINLLISTFIYYKVIIKILT